ncbi:MAG: hypothetical protein JWO52_2506 [Gammaproteobacteria bacterium]|nr:hypothetical protein [Gammaproteobacteria bacterium]
MSDHRLLRVSRNIAALGVALCALALVCPTARLQAAVKLSPLATVSVSHDSNVFARPPDEPPFASTGNTQLGDTIIRYLARAVGDFDWGLNRLSVNVQGERFQFNRFTQLNHNETKFGGLFDWHLGGTVDGSLEYSQRRSMAPLADTFAEQLEIQTDKIASGTFRFMVTPRWRIDLQPTWHEFDSPLTLYPDFGDKDTGLAASLNYLGIQKLTAGLRLEYLDGRYHGIVAATKYHQATGQLTLDYAVSGFSSFDGQLGYTKRQNSYVNSADANLDPNNLLGNTTGLTGSLGFRRVLSVKTSVGLRVFREIASYVAGANSEVSTGGDANLKWEPDVKFTVVLRYRMATQAIGGTLAISRFAGRTDHTENAELDVEYHALKWLTLRPYVLRNVRSSNFHEANFNSSVVGVDVTAHLN